MASSTHVQANVNFQLPYLNGNVQGPVFWDTTTIGGYQIPNQAIGQFSIHLLVRPNTSAFAPTARPGLFSITQPLRSLSENPFLIWLLPVNFGAFLSATHSLAEGILWIMHSSAQGSMPTAVSTDDVR
jgi:hypothetical protein